MRKWKVVVTDHEYMDLRFEEKVFESYPDIELLSAECRTEEDVIAACHDADALINQYAPISRRVIESLQNCKVITRYGVGVNTIDLDAATEKGICAANVPDYCMDEVSDHVLALMLSWARKVTHANHHVKNGNWEFKVSQPIYRLRGRTIGMVGFGKIPQALAEKVKALGLAILAYDPYFPRDAAKAMAVELVSLDDLCKRSHFISVHAPLNSETKGLLGKKQFALMGKQTVVVNTSRGEVIDEAALITALQNGDIAGAALDVTEVEPIDRGNPLLRMEQVIITPHVAWYSEESAAEMRSKAAMGVADVLVHGQYPKYLVNSKVKERIQLLPSQVGPRYSNI